MGALKRFFSRRKSSSNANRLNHHRRKMFGSKTSFESLESRFALTSSAVFDAPTGVLTITGDSSSNAIFVSNSSGYVYVADNATLLTSGAITASSVKRIDVSLGDNNDIVDLRNVNAATFSGINQVLSVGGGSGADTIYGSPLVESFNGGIGDDTYIFTGAYNAQGGDYISDSSGSDSIDFSAITGSGVTVDLATGSWNIVGTTFQIAGVIYIENVIGTSSADTFTASSSNNSLNGGTGNDTYKFVGAGSAQGADAILDSSGIDILDLNGLTSLSSGATAVLTSSSQQLILSSFYLTGINVLDDVRGTYLGDVIYGNTSNNVINGYGGDDVLIGDLGNDTLIGGVGDDILDGEEGTDTYYFDPAVGNLGSDLLFDESGDWDTLDFRNFTGDIDLSMDTGGLGTGFQVTAGVLNLEIAETDKIERVICGSGSDLIVGNSRSNYIYGGDGVDSLYGGSDDDVLFGAGSADLLVGNDGNDNLWGGDGDDYLFGGLGDDFATGESGNDTLSDQTDFFDSTEGGADRFEGGDGNDSISTYSGNDFLEGGLHNDTLSGGAGDDLYYFQAYYYYSLGSDTVAEAVGGGTDALDFRDMQSLSSFNAPNGSSTSPQTISSAMLTLTFTTANTMEQYAAPDAARVQVLTIAADTSNPASYAISATTSASTSVRFFYSQSLSGYTATSAAVDSNGADGYTYSFDANANFSPHGYVFTATVDGLNNALKRVIVNPFWSRSIRLV